MRESTDGHSKVVYITTSARSTRNRLIPGAAAGRPAIALIVSLGASWEEFMRALIFDLDGTLVDTVYAHVFACSSPCGSGMAIQAGSSIVESA